MPVNLPQRLINPEPNQKFLRGPLGMEGANAQGMGGGSGARRPGACRTGHLRRSWRVGCLRAGATDCPHEREVRIRNQCDSEAAGEHTTPLCGSFTSSTGSRGSLCARNK